MARDTERERVARRGGRAAADAHDMPAREQKFPLVMRMRDVKLGTWACTTGDDVVEVSWSKVQVKFRPVELNPSVNAGALHEDLPLLKFRYEHIAKIERTSAAPSGCAARASSATRSTKTSTRRLARPKRRTRGSR